MPDEFSISNEYLLKELQAGEERAFDFLFKKYYKALCAQAVSYVSELDIAQSLVQDCFIRLWEKRSDATTIQQLSPFLLQMVRNRCIDYIRKQKSMDELHRKINLIDDENNSSIDIILYHEFEENLVNALAILPERSRMAFEYSRFEGFSYPEIAIKMGITPKAVEALISRALKILRRELKEYLPIAVLMYKIINK